MKITVSESDLVNAINTVYRAVPSKTTMNILKCILIDAAGQKITFIANDMELGIQTSIEGTIEEKGIVAVDADILSGIVRKLPDGNVLIETTDTFNPNGNLTRSMIVQILYNLEERPALSNTDIDSSIKDVTSNLFNNM